MSPFRIIILAALCYILYRLIRGGGRKAPPPPPVSDDVLVEDPVCHTYIPQQQAVVLHRRGKTIHFCSTECRDRYLRKSTGA